MHTPDFLRSCSPPRDAFNITPHDTNDLPQMIRCFWVGTAGDVCAIMESGAEITLPNVAAGIWHPGYITRIKQTGTTAAGIIGGA